VKYFIYILITIATSLMIYNATIIDVNHPLDGDSKTALISILTAGCVIVLLLILLVSRAIHKKTNKSGYTNS